MAVITGNNQANTLTGTAGADTIRARGGDDRLSGLRGEDDLFGEGGDDVLDGGAGDDLLDGGAGRDIATYVDLGSPILAVNLGSDEPFGGSPGGWNVTSTAGGEDALTSAEGLVGTRFDDRFYGGSVTSELVRGGGGNDFVSGGYASAASDTYYGGDGNDVIFGGSETNFGPNIPAGTGDDIYGGNGNDYLAGVDGDDRLRGEGGADTISGGRGRDQLTGGAGTDTFTYNNVNTGDYGTTDDFGPDLITDFSKGQDEILFRAGGNEFDPPELDGFADLDSNGNGVLDNGDEHVEVRSVSSGGASRSSTVIDAGEFNPAGTGPHTLTVFGVTGLGAGDFADSVL